MDTTFTILFGIVAILLPLVVARLVWKRFDHYFGRNDEAYMDSLEYFLKKLGITILVAFVLLWLGMTLVFNGSPNY
jgi:multidrug efflux pump subunit AcrB